MIENSQQIVKDVFLKHKLANPIFGCVEKGFADYRNFDSIRSHIHDNTTKANLVNSYVKNHLTSLIAAQNFPIHWVTHTTRNNRITSSRSVVIDGKILARPKKIGDGFTTKNQPTDVVNKFRSHETEELYKSSTKLIPVDIAYLIDDHYMSLEGVYLICPNGDKNLWIIPFYVVGVSTPNLFEIGISLKVEKPELKEGEIKKAANQIQFKIKEELKKQNEKGA